MLLAGSGPCWPSGVNTRFIEPWGTSKVTLRLDRMGRVASPTTSAGALRSPATNNTASGAFTEDGGVQRAVQLPSSWRFAASRRPLLA